VAEPIFPDVERVRARAPAKINLALRVGFPRDDGYHPLATVYHAVGLYDVVTATIAEPGVFTVDVAGEDAGSVPVGEDNLAVRAARLLSQHATEPVGASLLINKSIPVAGGLAGGSADAAAALVACAVLWDIDADTDQLVPLAARLGSDVPFALLGGTAVGSGRGESVVPALSRGNYHWVLAMSGDSLPTPEVYRHYDELGPTPPDPFEVSPELMNALLAGDPARLGPQLVNDLHPAAIDLMPQLRSLLQAGEDQGSVGAIISGSGPTCAFLAADERAADELAQTLSATGSCPAVRHVSGPVHGARVISG
jgi:4-diphosphocytidyl-2-C-methyl-D-erythritol kinase